MESLNWRDDPVKKRFFKEQISTRFSFGVACCKVVNKKTYILMVRKRYTYAFNQFVNGRYNSNNRTEVMYLFNNMTLEEKLDILSLNFLHLWYKIWLNSVTRTNSFFIAKNKFESAFLIDNGEKLRRYINQSKTNGHLWWDIPKGRRKNKHESNIICAVREFYEETGIYKNYYNIIPQAIRNYSFVDNNVRYNSTYFISIESKPIIPIINFSLQEQINEIQDIKWMDIADIRHVDKDNRLENLIHPIFNFIKRYNKKNKLSVAQELLMTESNSDYLINTHNSI